MIQTFKAPRLQLGVLAFVASLAITQLAASPAFAAVKTWDGGGSDNKFSTASNWSGDTVPVDGDSLLFDTAAPSSGYDLDNDISVSYSGLSSSTASSTGLNSYRLINPINFQTGATWSSHERLGVYADGAVNVAGAFTFAKGFLGSVTASGAVTVGDGAVLTAVPNAPSLTIENGGVLACFADTNTTLSIPVTLGGGSGTVPAAIEFGGCIGSADGEAPVSQKLTINTLSLQANAEIGVGNPNIVEVINLTKNGHTLNRTQYSSGKLITSDGTQENQEKTTPLNGDSATNVNIVYRETGVLNGTRADISVDNGGILKGTGTVDNLFNYGTLSPGNSPGTITVKQNLTMGAGSIFEAEILNLSAYDQMIVQTGGTVDITNATLDLKFISGGKVNQGEQFRLIDFQDASAAITGTFAGLAEGGRITIGSAVFSISYVGGTGNDVVLTALTTADAPTTPNTGFRLVTANPALAAALGILSASALLVAARRFARK